MDGETILAIVSAVLTTIITVVSILVRANVIGMKKEIVELKATIASAHAIIMRQNESISSLVAQVKEMSAQQSRGSDYS